MKYLTVEQVIEINRMVISKYNSKEQIGVKDISLLESAVFRPQQTVFGDDAYATIWDKASALFESIGKNHAFYNGNKRTAFGSLVIFLFINHIKFVMDQKEAEEFTVNMVNGEHTFDEISKTIRLNSSIDIEY